jgi:hypothetical protein
MQKPPKLKLPMSSGRRMIIISVAFITLFALFTCSKSRSYPIQWLDEFPVPQPLSQTESAIEHGDDI